MNKQNRRKKGFTQHYFSCEKSSRDLSSTTFPKDKNADLSSTTFPKDKNADLSSTTFPRKSSAGFTLIELLIVVAIIAILAVVIFVALDPLKRFQDSRDSIRWQTVNQISNAINLYQIDNAGYNLTTVQNMVTGSIYMITDGTTSSNCNSYNGFCDTGVSGSAFCISLADLVDDGYLSAVPISPDGANNWSEVSGLSGYTLEKETNGAIWVRSCESENSTEIYSAR